MAKPTAGGERDKTLGRPRHHQRGGRAPSGFPNGKRFEGKEPDLKGFIYDIPDEMTRDRFIKTTDEIITFVARKYKSYTSELVEGLHRLQLDDPQTPSDPDPTNRVEFERWKIALKKNDDRAQVYQNFRAGLYNLVFGQCTDALQDKLKSHRDFATINQDGIRLLSIIKQLTHTFEK
jgi:hypothetical protein